MQNHRRKKAAHVAPCTTLTRVGPAPNERASVECPTELPLDSMHAVLRKNLKELELWRSQGTPPPCPLTSPLPAQLALTAVMDTGLDAVLCAPTGQGKTIAYLILIVNRLLKLQDKGDQASEEVRCIILSPARELALQISGVAKSLLQGSDQTVVVLIGGGYNRNQTVLAGRPKQLIIATPGRLLDHIGSGELSLAHVSLLVLDEADRLSRSEFAGDIEVSVCCCLP